MNIKLRNRSHTIRKIPFLFGCHQVEVVRGLEIEMYRKEYFQCDWNLDLEYEDKGLLDYETFLVETMIFCCPEDSKMD